VGRVSAFAAYRANARPGISLPEVEGTTRPTDLRTVGSGNAERCSITLRGFPPEVARSGRRSLRRSARKRSCRAEIRCGVGASGSSAICERRALPRRCCRSTGPVVLSVAPSTQARPSGATRLRSAALDRGVPVAAGPGGRDGCDVGVEVRPFMSPGRGSARSPVPSDGACPRRGGGKC
jgi:hypothetical protein